MSSFSYQFIPDPAETVRGTTHIQRRQKQAWLSWAVWPMFLLVGVSSLAAGARLTDLWLLGIAVGIVGGLQLLAPWSQRRALRRLYTETPGLSGPQVYTFTYDGLTIVAGPTTLTLGWPSIIEADETAESFLLFYNKQCAYYIPKRAVGGALAERELRMLLRERLGNRADRLRDA